MQIDICRYLCDDGEQKWDIRSILTGDMRCIIMLDHAATVACDSGGHQL